MEFKDILLDLRKEKGICQITLAKELGVSKGAISFWETGQREPTMQYLKKIAVYFGVSTDYLVGLKKDPL